MGVRWAGALGVGLLGCGGTPDVSVDTDPPADTVVVDSEPADTEPVDTGTIGDAVLGLAPLVWLEAADLGDDDGDRVETWAPHGPAVVVGTQPLVERQPRVRVVDGRTVVRFDGTDDRVDLGAVTLGAGFTFAAIVAGGAEGLVVGARSEDGLGLRDGLPTLATIGDKGALQLQGDDALPEGLHLLVGVVADRTTTLWVDGEPVRTTRLAPSGWTGRLLGVGDRSERGDLPAALRGDVVTVLVFDRALSTCERMALQQGLAALHDLPSPPRRAALPYARFVADDVPGGLGDPVASWAARAPTEVGPASAPSDDARPRLTTLGPARALALDGVDDRLDLGLDDLTARALPPLAVAAVVTTDDEQGHLIGTGASVAGALRTFGTGLVVDGGRVIAKAVSDGQGVSVEGGRVDDGAPHVLLATFLPTGLELAVDGAAPVTAAGAPVAHPFVRPTLGASDGNATGAALDPLAVDVAELRIWGGPLDACDRTILLEETLRAYGAPAPAGPNLLR